MFVQLLEKQIWKGKNKLTPKLIFTDMLKIPTTANLIYDLSKFRGNQTSLYY